jgi:hypothetical protein
MESLSSCIVLHLTVSSARLNQKIIINEEMLDPYNDDKDFYWVRGFILLLRSCISQQICLSHGQLETDQLSLEVDSEKGHFYILSIKTDYNTNMTLLPKLFLRCYVEETFGCRQNSFENQISLFYRHP